MNELDRLREKLKLRTSTICALSRQLEAAEKKIKRLESRGFEDLHHENEQLKLAIKEISEALKSRKKYQHPPSFVISKIEAAINRTTHD